MTTPLPEIDAGLADTDLLGKLCNGEAASQARGSQMGRQGWLTWQDVHLVQSDPASAASDTKHKCAYAGRQQGLPLSFPRQHDNLDGFRITGCHADNRPNVMDRGQGRSCCMRTSYVADDYANIARRLKELDAERHEAKAEAAQPQRRLQCSDLFDQARRYLPHRAGSR